MKAGAAAARIHWALPPLPLGEGRGRGSLVPIQSQANQPTTASPHPSPLPGGEGTSQVTMKLGAAYPHLYWARAVLLPLPPGEGRGEGSLLLPPPLGEGWGRGSAAPFPALNQAHQPTTASPHPSPLPGGEGTRQLEKVKNVTTKVGAAYPHLYWARAVFDTLKTPKNTQKPFNAEQPRERGGRGGLLVLPPLPPGEGRGEGSLLLPPRWGRVGVGALRSRPRLSTKCFNPPPLALTLALSQRERELRGCLSQTEREQDKKILCVLCLPLLSSALN